MTLNSSAFIVTSGSTVRLGDHDPGLTTGVRDKERGKAILKELRKAIRKQQERLFAENRQSLLVVLQALDTGGKDGTIKDVFKGINQQGCRVRPFKAPNDTELAHDFLWRIHPHAPRTGIIQVFNRSHYEDVLIARVKHLAPDDVIERRYEHINAFERLLEDRGTRILKFYLHISRAEQKSRLEARLANPEKHWKFSREDIAERALWDDYIRAFEIALSRCSTDSAPWYIVPADHKWYRNVVVATAILDALNEMDPQFPDPEPGLDRITIPD